MNEQTMLSLESLRDWKSILNMAIDSWNHKILWTFLTNNVHFLKILPKNLLLFLFPKLLELFFICIFDFSQPSPPPPTSKLFRSLYSYLTSPIGIPYPFLTPPLHIPSLTHMPSLSLIKGWGQTLYLISAR